MKNYSYKINGKEYNVAIGDIHGTQATVNVNGTDYTVELPAAAATAAPLAAPVSPVAAAPAPAAAKPAAAAPAGAGTVVAPLPGTVLSIDCKVGDTVSAADTVVVLEAMKMENAIHAGRDGRITAINVKPGDSVLEGDTLVTIG